MVIMMVEISDFLSRVEASQYTIFTQKFHSSVSKTLKKFNGVVVERDNNNYLVTFTSVIDAVQCALKIQFKFKYVTPKHQSFSRRLKIALSASEKLNVNDIMFTKRMCEIVKDQVVISSTVQRLYDSANHHAEIDDTLIKALTPEEENFLNATMNYAEANWSNSNFNVVTFSKALNLNYGKLYRRLMKLTGVSPNNFIKDFRLQKALLLLHKQHGNIAQIAMQTGFNSSTYFSECFLKKYGIRPSKYMQQHC